MSAISEEVRVALYTAMNVTAVTDLASGGVHHKIAPQNASYPFATFQRISSNVSHAFGPTAEIEDDLWMIKASADEDSDTTKSPQSLCEDILEQIEGVIGNSLTLSSATAHWVVREGDIPELVETINDREVHTHGILYRIKSN